MKVSGSNPGVPTINWVDGVNGSMLVSKTKGLCSNRSRPANIIELWCNGNTTDSDPVVLGSNPGNSTKKYNTSTEFFDSICYIKL